MHTHYTNSKHLGGKIKHRYSDFLVREIYANNGVNTTCDILPLDSNQADLFNISGEEKDYLHFTMQKVNTDLQNVIKSLSLNQQCAKSRIGYAGLKDKRGTTAQRISMFKPNIELLKKINKAMVKFHSFSYSDDKINIGDLVSNHFDIIIRDISYDEGYIKSEVKEFIRQIENGIPNYFGEQRFGGPRDVTHEVGKMFLLGDTKGAIMHYLTKTGTYEDEVVRNARALISEGDYKAALKQLPSKGYRYERAILHHLHKFPNDYVGAFKELPNSIIYLFTHAYQSYLFNKYLDLRFELYGTDMFSPREGDITSDGLVLGPLFGFDFELAKGKLGELEQKILDDEGITLQNFSVKSFPELSSKGARRSIKMNIYNFKLNEIIKDEFFEEKNALSISFDLDKGCYATTLLDELMK